MSQLAVFVIVFYKEIGRSSADDPYKDCLPYWTHWGRRGQDNWCCLITSWCCEGNQSPINIDTKSVKAIKANKSLEGNASCLNMDKFQCYPSTMAVYNNVELQMGFSGEPPSIGDYVLDRILFRFGSKGSHGGSEHTLNNCRAAMEMQMILRNKKYATIQEAKKEPYGLEIVSVLFHAAKKYQDHNLDFYFLQHIPRVTYKGQKACIYPFHLGILLPPRLNHYYQYEGSLTEPPCTNPIRYYVFHNPKFIGCKQLNWFRGLQKDVQFFCEWGNCPMANNYRKLQCNNHRNVTWGKACNTTFYPYF